MRGQGDFPFAANFNVTKAWTLDVRSMVQSHADLLTFTAEDYIETGFPVAVYDVDTTKRGIYMCVNKQDLSNPLSWQKIGGGGPSDVPNSFENSDTVTLAINPITNKYKFNLNESGLVFQPGIGHNTAVMRSSKGPGRLLFTNGSASILPDPANDPLIGTNTPVSIASYYTFWIRPLGTDWYKINISGIPTNAGTTISKITASDLLTIVGTTWLWDSGSYEYYLTHPQATGPDAMSFASQGLSSGIGSVTFGLDTLASGSTSFASGVNTKATGYTSNAANHSTTASHNYTHAEGVFGTASGIAAHTEGTGCVASGNYSHAQGANTIASGFCATASGSSSTASGTHTDAGGFSNIASGYASLARGANVEATQRAAVAMGEGATAGRLQAAGITSFIHSQSTVAGKGVFANNAAILGGVDNKLESTALRSVILGGTGITGADPDTVYVPNMKITGTLKDSAGNPIGAGFEYIRKVTTVTEMNAIPVASRKIGMIVFVISDDEPFRVSKYIYRWDNSIEELGFVSADSVGIENHVEGEGGFASGYRNTVYGLYSHAEGQTTTTGSSATGGHAEGIETMANGIASHSEGGNTLASGSYSHAEGSYAVASGNYSHAQGRYTQAGGVASHASGQGTTTNPVLASGHLSFNHSQVSMAGKGALASNSAILGGIDNKVDTGASRSVVLGGTGLTATAIDTVYVPNLDVKNTIVSGGGTGTGIGSIAIGTGATTGSNNNAVAIGDNTSAVANGFAGGLGSAASNYSLGFGHTARANGAYSFATGYQTTTSSPYTVATGYQSNASGQYSQANGYKCNSQGSGSIAEGYQNTSSGTGSHAEGGFTSASNTGAHAEGYQTSASGVYSHAEGANTIASAQSSHAQGDYTTASGTQSHSGGKGTSSYKVIAAGVSSFNHSEVNAASIVGAVAANSAILGGVNNQIQSAAVRSVILGGSGINATAADTVYVPNLKINGTIIGSDGNPIGGGIADIRTVSTVADMNAIAAGDRKTGMIVVVTGDTTANNGRYELKADNTFKTAMTFGNSTVASGVGAFATGKETTAGGQASYAEGYGSSAMGDYSHAEGNTTTAWGLNSHAEGDNTTAEGPGSHAEGMYSYAMSEGSHAEGISTTAEGMGSHAEGEITYASGITSHAEGHSTQAFGNSSHSQGRYTSAVGEVSHSAGEYTDAIGKGSYAGGLGYDGYDVTAEGVASFVHMSLSASVVDYNGAFGDYSAILGGVDNRTEVTATRSVVLGGHDIIATRPDTVYANELAVLNLPTYSDNAAAVTGGLHAGVVYKTAEGVVRVVI